MKNYIIGLGIRQESHDSIVFLRITFIVAIRPKIIKTIKYFKAPIQYML